MKWISCMLIAFFCLVMFTNLAGTSRSYISSNAAISLFKNESEKFASSAQHLQQTLALVSDNNQQTITDAREALKEARLDYKRIEFLMEYFFKSAAVIYNGPPKYEVEEPFMEYQEPTGFQVIENLLFKKNIEESKELLIQQAEIVYSSAKDVHALMFGFSATDNQILESIRLELIRINTLGITGYDAPLLKSGMAECEAALGTMQQVLVSFAGSYQCDSMISTLKNCIQFLHDHPDFDSFDRLIFLTKHSLLLERQLQSFIKKNNFGINTSGGLLNYDAPDLFDSTALNINAFSNTDTTVNTQALIQLGKKLFFETALSGNSKISCATCHNPEKYFTDGLPKSLAFNGHSFVNRNAPTLLYAGFQFEQFWDGRAKSLEEQIKTVLCNPNEMNSSNDAVTSSLMHKGNYPLLFKKAFSETADSIITFNKVTKAITAYLRTLNPRNSDFDRYMQGEIAALTPQQIRGFNLFMGKAQCGTCHFAPLFNGLIPPLYHLSELEVLGTPKTDDLNKPENDTDRGRYNIFPLDVYEKAFKTPTVRNASATAPYMHNGAFSTLKKVMDFYNKGGGEGLGLNVTAQTLPAKPLDLTENEIDDIITFIESLKDQLPQHF